MNNPEEIFKYDIDELIEKKRQLRPPQRGAALTACIKRYKINLFFHFMRFQAEEGVYIEDEMTVTLANLVAEKIYGRSFCVKTMNKQFGKKGRTAAKKSLYFEDSGMMNFLLEDLKYKWNSEGYQTRLKTYLEHEKARYLIG